MLRINLRYVSLGGMSTSSFRFSLNVTYDFTFYSYVTISFDIAIHHGSFSDDITRIT